MSLQEVHVHILDLSETKKVWEFAEAFKRKYKALNVLVSPILHVTRLLLRPLMHFCPTRANCLFKCLQINNAGSIMSQRDVNAEGLEKSFATNVLGESVSEEGWEGGKEEAVTKPSFSSLLGVYILTKSLVPLLEKSADPRVVSPLLQLRTVDF